MKTFIRFIMVLAMAATAAPAVAGNLDGPGTAPTAGSGMPTTTDIYNRLDTGAAIGIPGTFQEPATGPSSGTARTLAEIQGKLPAPNNTSGAQAGDVLSGKTFWGLIPGAASTWGPQSGSMPDKGLANFTPGASAVTVPAGYYSGGQVNTDANLVSGNIISGKTIFGVTGTLIPGALPHAGVKKTGQTTSYATGDDGYYQYGINPVLAPTCCTYTSAYNTPALVSGTRFFDNGDGTVIDNITGLIWLQNANCTETVGGVTNPYGILNWSNALTWSNALYGGTPAAPGPCGLKDGSTAGQWRLPNINELHSLGPDWPPDTPFTAAQDQAYWSSSSYDTSSAWNVNMYDGTVFFDDKYRKLLVWPVRSGQ